MSMEVTLLVPSGAQGRRLEWAQSFAKTVFFLQILQKSHFGISNLIQ